MSFERQELPGEVREEVSDSPSAHDLQPSQTNTSEVPGPGPDPSPIQVLPTRRSTVGWRTHLLVLGAFLALTLFMTWPLPVELGSMVPGGGDAWQHIWNLWWVKYSLFNGLNPYHTDLLYYPDGVNLYLHTLVMTAGLIGIPLQLLGLDLIATYNLIVLSSFVLAGYSMFLLCHYLLSISNFKFQISNWASFVGGIVFTFAPYHFAHTYGHMNLISVQWMPFYVLLLLKAVDAPHQVQSSRFKVQSSKFEVQSAQSEVQSPKSKVQSLKSEVQSSEFSQSAIRNPQSAIRNPKSPLLYAAGAGALLAVNAYTDWTYAAYLLILTALLLLWRLLRRDERHAIRERGVGWRQGGGRLAVGLVVFILLVSPVLLPTFGEAQQGYARQDGHETLVYSSDAELAFIPSELHPLWGPAIEEMLDHLGPYLPIKNPSERTVFLGYTVLLLAFYAVWKLRKVWQVRFWAFAALVTWVLSLGPLLQLNGETAFTGFKVSYPLPYLIFFDLPFFSIMRSPSRLTVLTMMALAILAAYVVASLLRRLEKPTISSRARRWRIAGNVLVGVVVPTLILFEFTPALELVPPGWGVPIYSKIASEPERFALLELPFRPFGDFMAYQTKHGKPIVGGYLSRQPPYPTKENTPVLRYLVPTTDPEDPLKEQVAGGKGIQVLRDMQVKYIIIRWWAFNPSQRHIIDAKLATLLGDRPPDYHYRKDQVDVWQLYP